MNMKLHILRWNGSEYAEVEEIKGGSFSTVNVDFVRGSLKHYKPHRPAYVDEIWVFVNGPYSMIARENSVSLYLHRKTSYRAENPAAEKAA